MLVGGGGNGAAEIPSMLTRAGYLSVVLSSALCRSLLAAVVPTEYPREVCRQHLQAVWRALQAYQRDHGKLPPHLSELYPRYVTDKALFHCPADDAPGQTAIGYDDPKLPISYIYEFSVYPAPPSFFSGGGLSPHQLPQGATWRDFKQDSRRYFGDRVPVASCFQLLSAHRPAELGGEG
jgi:hypothetical protein